MTDQELEKYYHPENFEPTEDEDTEEPTLDTECPYWYL